MVRASILSCALLVVAASVGCGQARLLERLATVEESEVGEARLVRVTEQGLSPPAEVEVTVDRGAVVFLNDTRGAVIQVVFPQAVGGVVCGHSHGFVEREEAAVLLRPLPPGAAASLCLHRVGPYRFEVTGATAQPLAGTVRVRELP